MPHASDAAPIVPRDRRAFSGDGLSLVPWSTRFDEPIPLPAGGELRTLLDAGFDNYLAACTNARSGKR
jgi:hypothetical protein